MPGSIVCNVCGGKDFYNEAGFYFCNECQTQTQEIREQVFDQQDNTAYLRTVKTTVRQNKSFTQGKLTSWEIFNYILYGLVEELDTLGVNKDFKEVCYHLWMHYLTKLEIISAVPDGLPKLNSCFRRRDASIVFNRSFTHKRKKTMSASTSVISKSSANSSTNELDLKMVRKERVKQRRKLVRAEYDEYSNTNQSSDHSIHNQTLTSLGSDNESVSSTGSQLIFSKSAKKELLKIMSKQHLNLHINDVENKMTCHKFNKKTMKTTFKDAKVLTRNKLYSIIYIALLLTQDKFQLADIIRFCREGHLSFMEYKHFFEDIMMENFIDESVYLKGKQNLFASYGMREQTWEIYNFLNLKPCDISPDIIELCRRYCTELNLPNEVFNIVTEFINNTKPKFHTNLDTKILPNYEGRAMAFIMFALKVLFGFDGATEYEFSNFARLINKKQTHAKMFVFDEWFNYIQYRKLVLKNTYFPVKYLHEPNCRDSIDLYLKFMKQRKVTYDLSDEAATLPMKIAKKYLTDLELYQENCANDIIEFKPSVTPFRSYIDSIKSIEHFTINNIPINQEILRDRSLDSISFIISHTQYLKAIASSKCKTKQSAKNTNHVFKKMRKIGWEILSVHEENWHKRFEEGKMEILHFDNLLVKILNKQKANVKKRNSIVAQRLNKSEPILKYIDRAQPIRKNIGRNSKGRFCRKDSAENVGIENFHPKHSKWFMSSWYVNPALSKHEFNPSLMYQVMQDVETSLSNKSNNDGGAHETLPSKSQKCKYPTHYIPWLEYWINYMEFNTRSSTDKWQEFYLTLPKNFQWLLKECATIIEQKPVDLFMEFANVELYMCYVHVNNMPVLNKYCDNSKNITRMIRKVKNLW